MENKEDLNNSKNVTNKILNAISKLLFYCLSLVILIFILCIGLIEKNILASCVMIFALVLAFPDTHRELSKKIKTVQNFKARGLFIFIFFIVGIIFWIFGVGEIKEDTINKLVTNSKTENTKNQENQNNQSNIIKDIDTTEVGDSKIVDTNFDEAMINQFVALGFNIEEATEMQGLFYKMGITSLANIKSGSTNIDINKLVAFVAEANNDSTQKFYFTVENRKMFYAGFRDETLYDSSKGGILKAITDVHIPETKISINEYTTLQNLAMEEVKKYLNHPDSASFPLYDGWGVGRNDNKYKIIGKVEAKNSFGIKETINFSIWYIKNDSNYIVEAILIDGIRVK